MQLNRILCAFLQSKQKLRYLRDNKSLTYLVEFRQSFVVTGVDMRTGYTSILQDLFRFIQNSNSLFYS
jgi:hypothetical protein